MVDLNSQLNKQFGIKDPVNDPSQTIPSEDNNKISTTRSFYQVLLLEYLRYQKDLHHWVQV